MVASARLYEKELWYTVEVRHRNYTGVTCVLASMRSVQQQIFGSASTLASLLYAVAIGLLAAAAAFPPTPGLQRFAVDGAMASAIFDNFWGVERNDTAVWRWSKYQSIIHFDAYREYSGIILSLPLTAPQYPDAPATAITFATDVQSPFTLDIAPSWRIYHVLLAPEGWLWMHPGLQLTGVSASSGTADRRALGVAVGSVRIRPAGERLELLATLRCATVVVTALLAHAWLRLWLPSSISIAGSLGIALIPVAAWRLAPDLTAAIQPGVWDLTLAVGAGFAGLWLVKSALQDEQTAVCRKRAFMWLFGALSCLLVLSIVFSLRWRLGFDAANMIYLGWLIERHGLAPYRDFVVQNMPGTYLLSAAIGGLFGFTDMGLRFADQTLLLALLTSIFVALRPLGTYVGWAAAITFGLLYLRSGAYMALQREFILLVPLSLALIIARISHAAASLRFYLSVAAIGSLFGLAATIKPHAIIGLPIVAGWYVWTHGTPDGSITNRFVFVLLAGAAVVTGASLPILAVAGYLWSSGAWDHFLDIAINYWPLYNRLDRVHQTINAISYPWYVWNNWVEFGGHHLWLITALIGAVTSLRDQTLARNHRMFVQMLVALAIGYAIYPIPAGKFWSYHWLPMLFFLVLLTALTFRLLERSGRFRLMALLMVGMVIVAAARPAPELHLFGGPPTGRKFQRTDRIAAFLRERVGPDDRVQSLDWTGGANYAALIARTVPATSFVEDFFLYHHISHPTIQRLRQRFIDEFDASRPQFVIQITAEDKPWVSGTDTTRAFPELDWRLAREYQPVLYGDGFIIYERRTGS
jgi:hypothetical protein